MADTSGRSSRTPSLARLHEMRRSHIVLALAILAVLLVAVGLGLHLVLPSAPSEPRDDGAGNVDPAPVTLRGTSSQPARDVGVHAPAPSLEHGHQPTTDTASTEVSEHVNGRVVDPQGRPIPGIRVALYSARTPGQGKRRSKSVSDEDGCWQLPRRDDAMWVAASPTKEWWAERMRRSVPSDPALTVDLTLHPAVTLTGVVYGPDGEPWKGLRVSAQWSPPTRGSRRHSLSTTSGRGGRFRFKIPANGRDPCVWAWTRSSTAAGSTDVSFAMTSVSTTRPEGVELHMRPGTGVASGVLLREDGLPIAAGSVGLRRQHGKSHAQFTVKTAPGTGAFKMRGLEPGNYLLTASIEDEGFVPLEDVAVTVPATDLRLTCRRGHLLEGRVLGEPSPDTLIQWRVPGASGIACSTGLESDDGYFELGLQAPRGHVLIIRDERKNRYAVVRDVTLPGPTLEISLLPAMSIQGVVRPPTDSRRESRTITAQDDEFTYWGRVDEQGRFNLRALPPGAYRLGWADERGMGSLELPPIEGSSSDLVIDYPGD